MREEELMSLVIDNAFPKIADTQGGINRGKREFLILEFKHLEF